MMVLLQEDAGLRIGPNIHRSIRSAAVAPGIGAQPAAITSEAAPLSSSLLLGGLRRSFASSPWQKSFHGLRDAEWTPQRH